MTVAELKQRLNDIGVPEFFYSIDEGGDGLPSEKFCLNRFRKEWEVYYSERGDKTSHNWFKDENEACLYFLKMITSDSVVMANLNKQL
jgi:hypothetical protein